VALIKKPIIAFLALLLTLAMLSGCRSIGGQTIIDWVDFLKLNGISYTGQWSAVVTDPAQIGGEIGKVKFNVADNVHHSGYKTKEGDAAFLPKGTVVYEVNGYPDRSFVAVKDSEAYNGYRLYADDRKIRELAASLEPDERKVSSARLYEGYTDFKLLMELKASRAALFVSMLKRSEEREDYTPAVTNGDPKAYRIVLDTGDAIGYSNFLYDDGIRYYWHDNNIKLLPSEFAYYLAEPRRTVYTAGDIEFILPHQNLLLATGEKIKQDGSANNITLVSRDGSSERSLFPDDAYERLRERVGKENPGSGEGKTILYWASRPTAVMDGRAIAFESNKETVLDRERGFFNIHLINADGSGEKVVVDGAKYGDAILLDSAGSRLVAEGEGHSLLDIDVETGAVRKHEVNGHLDALSKDGRYVLYRGMESDAQVGGKLWVIDLETGQKSAAGETPRDYIFNKGYK